MVAARIKETGDRGIFGKFAGFEVGKRSASEELRIVGHQGGNGLILPDAVASDRLFRLGQRSAVSLSGLDEQVLRVDGHIALDVLETRVEIFCPVLMLDKADPRRAEPLAGERASSRFHPVAPAAVAGDVHRGARRWNNP